MNPEDHIKENSDWKIAITTSIIIFILVSLYKYLLIGDLTSINLRFFNNTFATSSLFLVGIAVLIGPLAKFIQKLSPLVRIRKEVGLMGFFFASVHVLYSIMNLLINRPNWFIDNLISFILGITSILILLIIALISKNSDIHKLGFKKWKLLQRTVYIGIILAVLHFIYLGAVSKWTDWFQNKTIPLPPESLVIMIFITLVLLIRLIVFIIEIKKEKAFLQTKHEEQPIKK